MQVQINENNHYNNNNQSVDRVRDAIANLNNNLYTVLSLYFGLNRLGTSLTLSQIAKCLEIQPAKCKGLINDALMKITDTAISDMILEWKNEKQ